MIIRYGIPVSPGVAIGEALIVDQEHIRIPRKFVSRDAVDDEWERLRQAVEQIATELVHNRDEMNARLGEEYGAIFSAHLQMLHDPRLNAEWERLMRAERYSPEHAVRTTLRHYASLLEQSGNPYLAERSHDLLDLEQKLLRCLGGRRHEELAHIDAPVVVLAHDLTPSETATLDRRYALGFATEIGGAGGHAAIVARGLEIPAVVGVGRFLAEAAPGELVVIDGDQGHVVLRPDEETLEQYRQQAARQRRTAARLEQFRDLPAVTRDGARIEIHANIEFPREAEACLQRGADGIGLYRTEFLYLGAPAEPDEEDHYRAYAEVIRRMAGRPVVIRTFDLGADKLGQDAPANEERNPFLGLRSIRLSLRNVPTFRRQLLAILRASALGDARVMFPMITTLRELRQAKSVLADAMEDLEERGVRFRRDIPVGMMVEVPSAVVLIDQFLAEVDFVSIGTNDLIQYTLAVDRSNREVADLYHETEPAVLRLIELTVQAAARHGKSVSLCGQMSANPLCAMLLIGLGLRSLSVPPAVIPEIKEICRSVTLPHCEEIARRALRMQLAREIDSLLSEELRKVRR